ncbi:CCA tRNA nucleotidyltransferase [Asticcacaulis sp. ZE23SCel15]|uniref:CCA tRNA nucleotidyltransferase n=1 Tax=Asticcacaulis sp. ZE23SCel15 TaxID=3059027 RepID=UPI00265EDC21|nr:CCA tRNA nucleotidyltransferase [Asticcacaulis sp. ZE23SCel15]WKL56899.1 CCA tRNA nucleotidyltransferase [Asticcacaulis sp. ZE23SCel15]
MKLDLPVSMRTGATLDVFTALEATGGAGCVRFVGGSVRNLIMGLPVSDFDLSTQLTPDDTEAALDAADIHHIPTGKAFGTITAVVGGETYEITSLRRDVETDGRRAVVSFTTDWTEDAQRRDFYLNALYADIRGQVYDPTGKGLEDANARVVRFIGEAEQRIREDYLRILRFFRFSAAYAQTLDAESLEACVRLRYGIDGLSGERLLQELTKMLVYDGATPVFNRMWETGIMSRILPGLEYDPAQSAVLTRMVQATDDTERRFMALLAQSSQGQVYFNGHVSAVTDVLSRLKVSNRTRQKFDAVVKVRQAMDGGYPLRRALYDYGREAVTDEAYLTHAQTGADLAGPIAVLEHISVPEFPLTAQHLMAAGIEAGPYLGQTLKRIEADWCAHGFSQSVIDRALDELGKQPKISGE